MADKSVGELIAAQSVTPTDLFVLEQNGTAKKLTGQILENWLVSFADGHGGIQSIVKLKTEGLADTYRITLADTTTFDFVVTNGRSVNSITKASTSGLVDTYQISYNDGTSGTFTVTNGAKGDKGDTAYIFIKYASQQPTASSSSFGDVPDDWMGVYFGFSSTAPTNWQEYAWYKIKGEKGDTGEAATLLSGVVTYQTSTSGTIIPSGSWQANIPVVSQGNYLWTRTVYTFNTGEPVTQYSVARFGIDGSGAVSSVAGISPDAAGNVALDASHVKALPIGGGTMLGPINMNGQALSGLNAPLEETDAANKQYVDENAGDITIDMEGAGEGEANGINADTLGGQLPGYYATKEEVEQRISMKLLWTNPNPTSAFAEQTIALNLTDYDFIMIAISDAYVPTLRKNEFCRVGYSGTLSESSYYETYTYFWSRSVLVSYEEIVFQSAVGGITSQTGGIANERTIPVEIYGIKGVM